VLLLLVEVLFALTALVGVWFVFWPAALILGGVLGVVACERAASRQQVASVTPINRERVA
jgi:hypothetical protein